MEAWLPWLVESEKLLTDLLPDERPRGVGRAPARARPRRSSSSRRKAALTEALAGTWGERLAGTGTLPRLHVRFDRLLAATAAPVLSLPTVAEGPDVPAVSGRGIGTRSWRRGASLAEQLIVPVGPPLLGRALCFERPGRQRPLGRAGRRGGGRLGGCPGRRAPRHLDRRGAAVGRLRARRPRVAVLAESDVTGRRRPAPAGRGRGPDRSTGSSTTSPRAATSSTASTASPATAAWSPGPWAVRPATTCCSSTGAATGSTSRPTRSTAHPLRRRRDRPRCRRWGAPTGSGTRARARAAATRSPRSWSTSTGPGASRSPVTPSRRTPPGSRSSNPRSPSSRRPTSSGRSTRSRRTWSGRGRWTGWSAATSGSARPRSPCGPCSRPSRTATRRRCSCRPRCSPASTPRPSPTATRRSRCGWRCCQPVPHRRRRRPRWSPAWPTARSTWSIGDPPPAGRGRRLQEPGAPRGRRGAAIRGHPQRGDQGAGRAASTCSP